MLFFVEVCAATTIRMQWWKIVCIINLIFHISTGLISLAVPFFADIAPCASAINSVMCCTSFFCDDIIADGACSCNFRPCDSSRPLVLDGAYFISYSFSHLLRVASLIVLLSCDGSDFLSDFLSNIGYQVSNMFFNSDSCKFTL